MIATSLSQLCGPFGAILADPPWRFQNRSGKVAPEHKRLRRYSTMTVDDICALPIANLADEKSHLYLCVPNALVPWGHRVMAAWGFEYKTLLPACRSEKLRGDISALNPPSGESHIGK